MPSSKLKIAAIVGSLAALAIIVSPILSFPSSVQNPGGNNFEEPPPPQVTEEDLEKCNSIDEDVNAIIVEVDESRANDTRKTAAGLLLAEYCDRPELIHEISPAAHPGLSLTAYACDAASGKIGDTPLKESLADLRGIYCESASFSIQEEADALRSTAESFRDDYIMVLKQDKSTSAEFIAELEASLDEVIGMIDDAEALLAAGQNYESAKMLDAASRGFQAVIEKAEQDT